ncbi:MAG: aminotransferase class V-fold PLP-dependent enzyme [Chloroherpetonaceae bacterium]|nr:aminotransferase class V-fold PLP-dependent enzyme [Chloroherpetonaceae bacterium]MCS7212526.1 aminotransferase class V-fold PLP-dependent enzyme [Chloroherpetonaceae bacterium]MDW8019032.1 aminotransferase class V-fold PLP-dependent enzyme [Chloroherpetonaceae bacterium]MDW8466110.1 aminotransferase class V-fold PLP-dependent enzyme [Chloroherpetonaceae bacterium]
MYREHYSRFLSASPHRLHFAAHSHHLWLDVTRAAQLQYWDDSAKYADKKWEYIFSTVVPKAQRHTARILDLSYPEQIVFAPNTHEFVARLLSCLDWSKPIYVLTTDSEFYSFTRQAMRLCECAPDIFHLQIVPVEPFETFVERFCHTIRRRNFNMIFFSHVFFNSGFVVEHLETIVSSISSPETIIVIDGYHGFCAIPTSLKQIEHRIFYLSGGYKYAQSGEGVCFLAVPKTCSFRPIYTGWFAEFGKLSDSPSDAVAYSEDGFRFAGATFDPSGLYRFNAAMDWLQAQNLSIQHIHKYVSDLQSYFLDCLDKTPISFLPLSSLCPPLSIRARGHFLTFERPNAAEIFTKLSEQNIYIDRRGNRLRFGFGLYHTKEDIDELFERLRLIS